MKADITRGYAILLLICLAAPFNPALCAKGNSLTTISPSIHEPTFDEIDELMQSAKAAISIINTDINTRGNEFLSQITKLRAALTQVPDSAWSRKMKSILNQIAETTEKLKTPIQSSRIEDRNKYSKDLTEALKELDESRTLAEAEIGATENRIEKERDAAIVNLVGSCVAAGAAFGLGAVGNAGVAGAFFVLSRISKNRLTATKFAEFIQSNNRASLAEMLKRELPGSKVDVREVKDTDGLMAIFRINEVTHCLSSKRQCGGKPYSVTK